MVSQADSFAAEFDLLNDGEPAHVKVEFDEEKRWLVMDARTGEGDVQSWGRAGGV